ncbi:NADH-quinone oxidoreductase subunit L, partial [Candidatus Pelagibacter ubique]|nr:NADH-quinone oxidoreductase subunit L [Candidatus Pelagibacter ubique]
MEIILLFLPLLASITSGFFGKYLGDRNSEILTSLFVSISALLSIVLFYQVIVNGYENNVVVATWINSGTLDVNWSIKVDALSSVMLVVVTLVSALVHIYSIGYMSHDPHKPRFMAYLSLFTFSMLTLVTSDNFLQLFFGWEGVGLCSYFLIGFWFKKETANAAAIKAFVVNRVGDFGFALGIFLIFYLFGTVNYVEVFNQIPQIVEKKLLFLGMNVGAIDLICILLFIGAMGKSAQIFLHTWLPDAMEGPTPVSALIHAATMVTAGVFLVVRCSPIFEYSPLTLNIITVVGMTTAFFAATVALVQTDIKKIIAYSTCSQLGYMFFAAGVGAYNVAMFHLFTHAFFKALLFLGSGSVIHSFKDEQDINQMGGVYKKLPYTYIFMIIGTLALTGFPFLSGFYSKDAIIEFAYLKGNTTGYYAAGIGILTAVLTSIYSWRLIFKTFHGDYNNKKININEMHDSPLVMLLPLFILAIGAIFAGFLFKDLFIDNSGGNSFWGDSIKFLNPLSTEHPPLWFLLTTPALVLTSIPIAYYLFVKDKDIPNRIAQSNKPLHNFLI